MESKKLYCIVLTNSENWDSPTVMHARATNSYEASKIAFESMGYDVEEIDNKIMSSKDDIDYIVLEVDAIIEADEVNK